MSKTKTGPRPMTPCAPPSGHESFVADALRDAMLARDVVRVREIGKIAADLVALEIEQARRQRAVKASRKPDAGER
jgi:hypothetical protein